MKMFLKPRIFKAITFKDPVGLPLAYYLWVAVRFFLTLLPQNGYLHPDEFFQNVEVIAGDILNVDVARTWEFDPRSPIRNIFIPKLIFGPPLHLIRILNPYTKAYLNIDLKTPYYLLVIPRIFICLLSLINDYCLYKICITYKQNFRNRLKIFASSYVVLIYCCRSFSNTFEIIFFSLLLYYVADCMSKSDRIIYHDEYLKEKYEQAKTAVEKVKVFKMQNMLPEHSLNRVFIISTLVVIGIFNRPTFIGYAFAPMFFWLHRGLGSKVIGFKDFNFRIFSLIFCAVPAILCLILVDSFYYGYFTMADLESSQLSLNNWVVTPWNFLKYNLDPKNLKRHGVHPRWTHVVMNIPLLFNVLGGLALYALVTNIYRFICGNYSKLPRIQSITGLMLFSIITPVAALSIFTHQEPRFIIPILLPLVYLFGNHLHPNETDKNATRKLKKVLLTIWYAVNICLTIFYGFIHQGGLYPFVNNLHYEIKSMYGVQTHVITTHSYSVPTYLLQLESTTTVWKDKKTGRKYRLTPSTNVYKYGSLPVNDLFDRIDEVLTNAEMLLHQDKKKYRFYVASPCALSDRITDYAKNFYYFDLAEEFLYYPHFCSEAVPEFPSERDVSCLSGRKRNESLVVKLNLFERISCYLKRFCFKIFRVRALTSPKYT